MAKENFSPEEQLLLAASSKAVVARHILRALDNKLRLHIMRLLVNKPGITVTEVYVTLRIEQSVASQQLGILRQVNLVTCERSGKNIHYTANTKTLMNLLAASSKLVSAVGANLLRNQKEAA